MKWIARIKSFCFAIFIFGAISSLPSCFQCLDVECENGTCSQGVCECFDGYYGSECQYSTTVSGYDCVSGSCVYTSDNASYSTISECQDYCASNCIYDVFNGGGSCLDAGNFPISASACCSPSYPFYCSETGLCYTSCEAADAACAAATVVTGAANGSAGYTCASGNCNYVTNGASYSTLAACEASCGGGGSAGYDCVGGTCNYVSSGADYSTQSACESACGGSGPATGRISVKIYYKPTGECEANDINHILRFYYYCAHGTSLNSVSAGIWNAGEDGGGLYRTCVFGNETAALCGHGSTLYNRIYRLEWQVTPDILSFPNTCNQSGATNIDFQDQVKNVVIDWW